MMRRKGGFTLIEMIGVLAVISILAAMIAPRVFKVIKDSRITRVVGDVRAFASAPADWYKDTLTLSPLTGGGVIWDRVRFPNWQVQLMTNGSTDPLNPVGLWLRWRGPYIDAPPSFSVGGLPTIENCRSLDAPVAGTNCNGISFDDNDGNDVAAGGRIVWMVIPDVSNDDFRAIDRMIDGTTAFTNAPINVSGRVKCSGLDSAGTVYIYLASD